MRPRTIVTCEKCSGTFRFKPLKRKLPNGIEMHYIKCRHCRKEYVSYYTDEIIRQQLQDNEVKRKELRERMMASEDEEEIKRYVEQINQLSQDVGKQMDLLKERIDDGK
ncbi:MULTISPECIES: transglycosylase [Bacillus cereus group]|uniref:transglycosylase n=1 Tax=Bacillus cereus group TaxID=86661 RepID=UPI001AEE89EF|nr:MULTISPECIES: transglycosylase [Bacillus cereus group]QTR79159.1 transglycosylase [Bacillus cytotoxicus]